MTQIKNRFTGKGSIREVAEKNRANFSMTNLSLVNLFKVSLSMANLEFAWFPSIRLLSSINLGDCSNELTLELMRRDAQAHPHPERFDEWAKGGPCPYQNEEFFWNLRWRKDIWKPGTPQMRDSDLLLAICKEKGWGIKGYLKIEGKGE